MKNGPHRAAGGFNFSHPVYARDPDRVVARIARQVQSRLKYPDVSKVTVVFDSTYPMPASYARRLRAVKGDLERIRSGAVVKFVTWP